MFIEAFVFPTKQVAQEAVAMINEYFGIPKSAESITQTFTSVKEWNEIFYLPYDPSVEVLIQEMYDISASEIEINPFQLS